MNKVLYFPYINVPDNRWTLRSLLYWDKIGSIVPGSYGSGADEQITPFMRSLLDCNLVERINPYKVRDIFSYDEIIIEAVLGDKQGLTRSRENFSNGKITRIHREKFNYGLFNRLEQSGVALQIPSSNWFIVESNIAKTMMIFLATAISKEKGFQPATDQIENLEAPFGISDRNTGRAKYATTTYGQQASVSRGYLLEQLMPYPYDLDLRKVLQFKERNYDDLKAFRKKIEHLVFTTSLIPDEQAREFILSGEINEIREEKERLLSKMSSFNFNKIFFGGVCGTCAVLTPVLSDPALMSVPAMLYALHTLHREYYPNEVRNSVKYLALVERNFQY